MSKRTYKFPMLWLLLLALSFIVMTSTRTTLELIVRLAWVAMLTFLIALYACRD